nr:hypothetical protein [Paenibacillus sp. Soil522]
MKIVNVALSFIEKEVSFTSIAQGDIHPSRAGYAAMGKALSKAIWGDYLVVKPRESGVKPNLCAAPKHHGCYWRRHQVERLHADRFRDAEEQYGRYNRRRCLY